MTVANLEVRAPVVARVIPTLLRLPTTACRVAVVLIVVLKEIVIGAE